jgi:hypothetical protein
MKSEIINTLVQTGILRIRQRDTERIKSIISSAETNTKIAVNISLNEDSATLIFREVYESIRQIGDAKWWLLGYEPQNHDISLEILKEMDIKEKVKLNFIDRFRKIRNDANYRGFKVSISQAKEIIEFWDKCGKEMIQILHKEIK